MTGEEWIAVEDDMPPSGTKVIAFYINRMEKPRAVMAEYIPRYSVYCHDYYDYNAEFEGEFLQGDDDAFVLESWHEIVDNWDDFSGCEIVEGTVTHWVPLPEPPAIHKGGDNG